MFYIYIILRVAKIATSTVKARAHRFLLHVSPLKRKKILPNMNTPMNVVREYTKKLEVILKLHRDQRFGLFVVSTTWLSKGLSFAKCHYRYIFKIIISFCMAPWTCYFHGTGTYRRKANGVRWVANNTIVIKLYCDFNFFTFNCLCFYPVNYPRILADVKCAISNISFTDSTTDSGILVSFSL